MASDFQDNESDVRYKLGVEQSPRRSQDEDLDSDLDVCLLDDVSSDTRKNMSDVPDEDLSDDLLQSDEEEQIMSYHDTVDSSQITSHLKTPCNSQEEIVRETIRESPLSPEKETVVDLKGRQGPQGKNISGQDGKRVRSCTAGVTEAEELGSSAGDQESEDEAVDVEINEPFDDEFQECWEEEEEESNEEEDDDDEQPCHSRFKSERKEGMMVVRLSDGARHRRNIPDTLELSGEINAALKDCKTGAKQPANRPAASDAAWGRGGAGGREQSSRMEVRGNQRGFEARPPHPTQRPSVQPPPPPPPPSYQRPRPPQQRFFNQPPSFAQPSHQVPLMSAQSQAKPAVAPQCLSGAAASGPPRFPQPPGSQHAEPWRGQAPPKERSCSEPQVPGQHMLDQWRCPRPLDCNPRFPLQACKRPPPPSPPRPRTEPWPQQGQGLELELELEPGPGREQEITAGMEQPPGGRREPLKSWLPLPPPHKVPVVFNSGPHLSRPLLLQGQPSPRPCTPTTDQPPATPCVSVHPARSKVSPSFTMVTAPAPAEAAPTQPQPQPQPEPQPQAQRQPRPHFPGLSGTGPPEHVRKDVSRPTPAPAAQVRPISRAEQSAKPVVVARGVPATAMPAQRAKAEPAASAAPEPRAPTRNVGQKVKEEPPSPALRAQRAPAKACVQAKEEEDEETRVYREKMEEQKRKRAEVVRQKELRRQQQAKETQRALQEHRISQSQVDQQRWPRGQGPRWGQGWGAHPYQQGQREGPPWQFDTRDTFFQGPGNMGPAHFREEQQDEQFPRGPSSFHHSQRGPPRSWTDRLQELGPQNPLQQSQQRQSWEIQHHMQHQNQPHARFTPGNFSSDMGPRSIHGLGSHQPQSQMMPPPPRCFQERPSSAEPPSDRFTSGPWPRLAPDEQSWFQQPPEVWSPPGEWGPQTLQQTWVRLEEQGPPEPIRPTLKRVFAQMGDGEDEVQSPVKVIRQIIQHVRAEEEHSAQCFSTRDDVVKHEDNRNVTRLITVGRSLQPRPAEMLNMDMDDGGGFVCATHERTGLCRRCTNSLPNSNLIVKINY
ncbi:RNA-binding protein 33 isoform X2 [Clupea harengus]|uniref:RNA-binding protein 33 isoform X2 n=1 Tax=Clupea harengus TaxID=7950 RepID=A0A6P8F4Z1_CLUHA|nr:RNA-binding protein 33 isoform X2 [Clupea harengus]